jgi:hypothetical protein
MIESALQRILRLSGRVDFQFIELFNSQHDEKGQFGVGSTAAPVPSYQVKALAKIAAAPAPKRADIARYHRSVANNGRAGGELRGNSHDRHSREQKLLNEFGNGKTAKCVYCGKTLTASTITQDKIYPENGYRYANIVPACTKDNESRSNSPIHDFIGGLNVRRASF